MVSMYCHSPTHELVLIFIHLLRYYAYLKVFVIFSEMPAFVIKNKIYISKVLTVVIVFSLHSVEISIKTPEELFVVISYPV